MAFWVVTVARKPKKHAKCDMASAWGERHRRRVADFTSHSAGFRIQTTREAGADGKFSTPLPTTTNGAAAGRRPARHGGGGAARRRAVRPAAVLKAMRVDGNRLKSRWGVEEGARQGAFAAQPRKTTPQYSSRKKAPPYGQAPRAHERRPSGISHPPARPVPPPSYLVRRVVGRAQKRSIWLMHARGTLALAPRRACGVMWGDTTKRQPRTCEWTRAVARSTAAAVARGSRRWC